MNHCSYIFLIVIGIVFSSNHSIAQWEFVPIHYEGLMNRVFFSNQNCGWVFGGNFGVEFISNTKDGGITWSNQSSGGTGKLLNAYFADSLHGWAVGDYLRVIKSTDGGNSWIDQRWGSAWYEQFRGISFVDSQIGWLAGRRYSFAGFTPVIFHTTNEGLTWQEQQVPYPFPYGCLNNIMFTSKDTGFAVGWISNTVFFNDHHGLIVRTTNGGVDWNSDVKEITQEFYSIYFINKNEGWIVGRSGVILHTTDGGNSWEQQSSGTTNDLSCVAFSSTDIGWIGGDLGMFFSTTDKGQTWITQSAPTYSANITSLQFLNNHEGWGSTDNGLIHTANGNITLINPITNGTLPSEYILYQNYPNPFNPVTNIQFQIPISAFVKLEIFDQLGRKISTLLNEYMIPGLYEVNFSGVSLASGIYFYRLHSNNFTATGKMLLIK